MRKIFQIGFLLTLVSCGQNSNESISQYENKNQHRIDTISIKARPIAPDTDTLTNTEKHQTYNETIDTLPQVLKVFIPGGYSAINVSSGDANLDGLTDRILVLKKTTEETSNYADYANGKFNKRPLLLLLGQGNGSYKLAAKNENVVSSIECGGGFGDPFTGITIKWILFN